MKIFFIILGITAVIAAYAADPLFAAGMKRTASLMVVQGTVEIKPANGEWVPGRAKTALVEGDFIKTGRDSLAIITINDAAEVATVELKEKTNMELARLGGDIAGGIAGTMLDLYAGEVMVNVRKAGSDASKFEVKTPTSVVAVQGEKTSFSVKVDQFAE